MPDTPTLLLEVPESQKTREAPSPIRHYEANDFRFLYEREFFRHPETQRKLQAALDEIAYWRQKVEKLDASEIPHSLLHPPMSSAGIEPHHPHQNGSNPFCRIATPNSSLKI